MLRFFIFAALFISLIDGRLCHLANGMSLVGTRSSSSHYEAYSSSGGVTSSGHTIKIAESSDHIGAHHVAGLGTKIWVSITEKEKKELQGLNERLSNYIARVKLLEEQNHTLVAELEQLRVSFGSRSREYKLKFTESLSSTRSDIGSSQKARAALEVRASRLRDDIAEYRSRYDEVRRLHETDASRRPQWTLAISECEEELKHMKHRLESVLVEERRANEENARIWSDIYAIRASLDVETIARIDYQSQVQQIQSEIAFLRRVHETEISELNNLVVLAPADTKEFFRNELALAIRDIRKEYEAIAARSRVEVERWYHSKVSEVQSQAGRSVEVSQESAKTMTRIRESMSSAHSRYSEIEAKNKLLEREVSALQSQVYEDQRQYELAISERERTLISMRQEVHKLLVELQSLLDVKQVLDTEIAIYRTMLEGEEKRVGVVKIQHEKVSSDQWESSIRTKFQTTATGNVSITQCDPTGRFVVLENTSKTQDEFIGNWRLTRVIDNAREINYHFPNGTVIRAGHKLKILARDQGVLAEGILLFENETSWGMGSNVVTRLFNAHGEQRAVYTQTTVTSAI